MNEYLSAVDNAIARVYIEKMAFAKAMDVMGYVRQRYSKQLTFEEVNKIADKREKILLKKYNIKELKDENKKN